MTLPKKGSRTLNLDGTEYRWLVTVRQGILHLTIEKAIDPGQRLQAYFEPHNLFKRGAARLWSLSRQGRSITPDIVARIIRHGLANDWQPASKGQKPLYIHTWESDKIIPAEIETTDGEIQLKDLAIEQVSQLRCDLSLDPNWRQILFNADVFKRFVLPDNYFPLSDRVRKSGLRFSVFNDGYTEDGFVVFGIESVDFPDVIMYTTNNPTII